MTLRRDTKTYEYTDGTTTTSRALEPVTPRPRRAPRTQGLPANLPPNEPHTNLPSTTTHKNYPPRTTHKFTPKEHPQIQPRGSGGGFYHGPPAAAATAATVGPSFAFVPSKPLAQPPTRPSARPLITHGGSSQSELSGDGVSPSTDLPAVELVAVELVAAA